MTAYQLCAIAFGCVTFLAFVWPVRRRRHVKIKLLAFHITFGDAPPPAPTPAEPKQRARRTPKNAEPEKPA